MSVFVSPLSLSVEIQAVFLLYIRGTDLYPISELRSVTMKYSLNHLHEKTLLLYKHYRLKF